MKPSSILVVAILLLAPLASLRAVEPPAEFINAGEDRREEIRLGGDFKPDPRSPVFVAVGHGARILLSRDDGKTWKQVFWGYPGSDHGGWATNSVAYTDGVFAVPIGWTFPTAYLASEDGVNWRHLSDGSTKLPGKGEGKAIMPTTNSMAGGKGVFVGSGYMTFTATPDFGKSFSTFSLRSFKDDARWPLTTHHVKTIYLGDGSERFLAIGDDRSKENPRLGHLFASDDGGKTWKWLEPKGLDVAQGKTSMVTDGRIVLLLDKAGENVFRSLDAGDTWDGPFATGTSRVSLSVANGSFWLAGKLSRVSTDGKAWKDLPETVPSGKFAASDRGTLISIDRRRFNILRSGDGGKTWNEVHRFEPETGHVHGAQGLRDVVFGYTTASSSIMEARAHFRAVRWRNWKLYLNPSLQLYDLAQDRGETELVRDRDITRKLRGMTIMFQEEMQFDARPAGQTSPPRADGKTEIPRETLNRLSEQLDVTYARYGNRTLEMDIYRPWEVWGDLPAIVCIHGGGWQKGSKINHRKVAQALAARGYLTASISYRLSGEARFPAHIQDCKAAVRFLRANAKRYGINSERIGTIGHSAGGHLAALLGTSAGVKELEGDGGNAEFSSAVQAAVPMGAQTDFLSERNRRISAEKEIWQKFLGGSLDENPETYRLASPLAHLDKTDPPMWLITGEKDDPSTHADKLRQKMREFGIPTGLTIIKDAPHPFTVQQDWFDEMLSVADKFFRSSLK